MRYKFIFVLVVDWHQFSTNRFTELLSLLPGPSLWKQLDKLGTESIPAVRKSWEHRNETIPILMMVLALSRSIIEANILCGRVGITIKKCQSTNSVTLIVHIVTEQTRSKIKRIYYMYDILAYGWYVWNLNWPIRIQQAGKPVLSWRQRMLTAKAFEVGQLFSLEMALDISWKGIFNCKNHNRL